MGPLMWNSRRARALERAASELEIEAQNLRREAARLRERDTERDRKGWFARIGREMARLIAEGATEGDAIAQTAKRHSLSATQARALYEAHIRGRPWFRRLRRNVEIMRLYRLGHSNAAIGEAVKPLHGRAMPPESVARIIRGELDKKAGALGHSRSLLN